MTDIQATERRRRYRPPRQVEIDSEHLAEALEAKELWSPYAACRDVSPALFYPEPWATAAQVESAKVVCRRCDCREACLAFALETGEQGIWGGTTERERARMGRPCAPPP